MFMSNFSFDQCQLLLITTSVHLLLHLLYAWTGFYPHPLGYAVISYYICSTQNMFAVNNFFSPEYDISRARVIECCIKIEG